MTQILARIALVALAVMFGSRSALSEPITLKLAFFSSDRSSMYHDFVAPFVDAVNLGGRDQVQIEVALSGALGRDPTKQAQLVLDGTADIALVITSYTPTLFPDDEILQLPGLFPTLEVASRTYSKLVADNDLRGYDRFHVIGVFASGLETIHSRVPITSLADLAGKRIRVNNLMEAAVVEKLGATAVFLPITKIANALADGKIDAATMVGEALIRFGIARIATHHFMLGLSHVPLALLMNRDRFAALPESAREIITKYSGSWPTEHFIANNTASIASQIADLKPDPRRTIVMPSAADRKRAEIVFEQVVDDWLKAAPGNAELLAEVKKELAKYD